eukprot:UN03168
MKNPSSLLVLVLLMVLCAFAFAQQPTKDVKTPLGTVRGYLATDASGYAYRGVPYAENKGRWKHSVVKTTPYGQLIDGKEDSPAFPQHCKLPPHTCPEVFSEDAYTVNIFTPVDKPVQPLPVMVFYHGGNFFQGSNGGPLYNGTHLATQGNVIIVTVNYRLGILGYYRDESKGIWGNFGVVDQINALKWTRANIDSWGGDPDNITIFGQSAGAASSAVLTTSPYTKGLFTKAIFQSNPWAIPLRSIATKAGLIKAFEKHTGCTTLECLLALSQDALIDAQNETATDLDAAAGNLLSVFIPFTPYIETPGQEQQDPEYPGLVPGQFLDTFAQGKVLDVPIMMGVVSTESPLFIWEAFTEPVSDIGYAIFGWMIFGDAKSKIVMERFPATKDIDNRENLQQIGSEFIFDCAQRNVTRAMLNTGHKQPVYAYVMDYFMSFNQEMWGPEFPVCTNTPERQAAVCHGADLLPIWNSASSMFPYSDLDKAVTKDMGGYWTNFAWSGSPNKGPTTIPTTWESVQESKMRGNMRFRRDGKSVMDYDYEDDACNWWDKNVGYKL